MGINTGAGLLEPAGTLIFLAFSPLGACMITLSTTENKPQIAGTHRERLIPNTPGLEMSVRDELVFFMMYCGLPQV